MINEKKKKLEGRSSLGSMKKKKKKNLRGLVVCVINEKKKKKEGRSSL